MPGTQAAEAETRKLQMRVENTEQRQQQMMAFLAKAVNNPGFLQALLQRQPQQRLASGRGVLLPAHTRWRNLFYQLLVIQQCNLVPSACGTSLMASVQAASWEASGVLV